MSESLPLAGKTALVTGGAARIGAAIGEALHQAGAHLIIHFRRSREAAEQLRDRLAVQRANSVSLVEGDLLDPTYPTTLAAEALSINNRLDILINNASSYYPTPLGAVSETDWRNLMGSNAKAPFFLSQALAPTLRAQRGTIINLVDIHAERPQPEHPIYCMAKAANAMLVKSLALELAPEVRVNGIAPGAILWPQEYLADDTHLQVLRRIPLGNPGTAQDIAAAVLFLARSSYITGQILAVDGGRTIQQ